MKSRFVSVVFDLDGTLIDTLPDSHAALNRVFAAEGLRRLTLEEMRSVVGEGARVMIERAIGLTGRALSGVDVDRLMQNYIAAYLVSCRNSGAGRGRTCVTP